MAGPSATLPSAETEENHFSDEMIEKAKAELHVDPDVQASPGYSISGWMKYLFNRDTNSKPFNPVWLSIEEYTNAAEESLQNAWRVINSPQWQIEKKGSVRGDVVESTNTDAFGKVYRFTGIVDCPAPFLFSELKDNLTNLPKWNPTILKSEIIKVIADGIDLSYQVTAGGGRGIIKPRDFVILRRSAALDRAGAVCAPDRDPYCYMSSGVSVDVPGYPPLHNMVRGHNKVGCWCLKPTMVKASSGKLETQTIFQWLMCCDLKGKIPQFVLDTAFGTVMLDYVTHVRKHVAQCRADGLI